MRGPSYFLYSIGQKLDNWVRQQHHLKTVGDATLGDGPGSSSTSPAPRATVWLHKYRASEGHATRCHSSAYETIFIKSYIQRLKGLDHLSSHYGKVLQRHCSSSSIQVLIRRHSRCQASELTTLKLLYMLMTYYAFIHYSSCSACDGAKSPRFKVYSTNPYLVPSDGIRFSQNLIP